MIHPASKVSMTSFPGIFGISCLGIAVLFCSICLWCRFLKCKLSCSRDSEALKNQRDFDHENEQSKSTRDEGFVDCVDNDKTEKSKCYKKVTTSGRGYQFFCFFVYCGTSPSINEKDTFVLEDARYTAIPVSDSICVVCIDQLEVTKDVIKLPCSHKFHKKCLTKWVERKSKCPICMADIRKLLLAAYHNFEDQPIRTRTETEVTSDLATTNHVVTLDSWSVSASQRDYSLAYYV